MGIWLWYAYGLLKVMDGWYARIGCWQADRTGFQSSVASGWVQSGRDRVCLLWLREEVKVQSESTRRESDRGSPILEVVVVNIRRLECDTRVVAFTVTF